MLDEELTMFMIQRILDIVNSRIRYATLIKHIEPFFRRFRLCDVFDHPLKFTSVLDSQVVSHVVRVCLPFRAPESIAYDAVETVVSAAEQDITV